MDWSSILRAVAPRAKASIIAAIVPHLDSYFTRYGITDPVEQAMFLAQAAKESDGFKTLAEYGDAAYFRRYDGRRDLGNSHPGDGYKFRGQGIFQVTGRANMGTYGRKMGVDLITHPELLQNGLYAVWSACLYWTDHGCGAPARKGDIVTVTRKINGGLNGLADRKAYFAKAIGVVRAYAKLEASRPSPQIPKPADPVSPPAPAPVPVPAPTKPVSAPPPPVSPAQSSAAGGAGAVIVASSTAAGTGHLGIALAIIGGVALLTLIGVVGWRLSHH